MAILPASNANGTWCSNPLFRGPASQVYDVKYVAPSAPVEDVFHKLGKSSMLKIRSGRRGLASEYYVRAGIIAPEGLSQKDLYDFAQHKAVTFSFYYNSRAHALIVESLLFMNAKLIQYNIVLKISTERTIDEVYVDCLGGV
jgi:hypothetical protein